jgi:hypothetical protein
MYKLNSDLLDRSERTFKFTSPVELVQCALNCGPGQHDMDVDAVPFANDNSAA